VSAYDVESFFKSSLELVLNINGMLQELRYEESIRTIKAAARNINRVRSLDKQLKSKAEFHLLFLKILLVIIQVSEHRIGCLMNVV
jgi:hypothetical protein